MSLFIEVGGLIMGVGAVVSGIFGMNLKNALEDHPYAFILVCVGPVVTMILLFAGFTTKYYQLKADTSSAQSFTLLKNFFAYVDDLEYNVFNKEVAKTEFKETVEKITGLKISDKESEYLQKMVDVNRNGLGPNNLLPRLNGSRLSILSDYREMQNNTNAKQFGSRLSVFSNGPRDKADEKSEDVKDVPESSLLQVASSQ